MVSLEFMISVLILAWDFPFFFPSSWDHRAKLTTVAASFTKFDPYWFDALFSPSLVDEDVLEVRVKAVDHLRGDLGLADVGLQVLAHVVPGN